MAVEKGQTFSADEHVDKYRAIYYAGSSNDYNPIHIDPEFGKMWLLTINTAGNRG